MTQEMTLPTEETRPKAISLFSGLGGLDIGLHQAGIETVACVEKNDAAAQTLRINSQKHDCAPLESHISVPQKYPWTVINQDIREVDAGDILEAANIDKSEIDLVVGGPPCQTFSRSNEGSRSGTGAEKGKLYQEYARLLHEIQPRAFIFENVRGLKSTNDGNDLDQIIDCLEGENYSAEFKVLNAADYGVPQTRKRLIIIGVKDGSDVKFPEPTHTENRDEGTRNWEKVGDALSGFDVDEAIEENGGYQNAIGSKHGHLLKDIPEGANYQHFSERKYDPEEEEYIERDDSELDEKEFDWRTRHWNYLLKIDRGRPSWTIQAAPGTTVGPFHWRSRKLSLLEQMRLMDLPLDYYIAGTPGDIQKQIGNAVPPSFAEAIAQTLAESLDLPLAEFEDTDEEITGEMSCTEDQEGFELEIDTDTSPWRQANRIIRTIDSESALMVKARQQAIPYAVDALEIAERQMDADLDTEVSESVDGTDESPVSILEAQVVSSKAEIKVTT